MSYFTDLLDMLFSLLLHFLPVLSLEISVCSILRPVRGQDPERKRAQLLRPTPLMFALVLYVAVGRCVKAPEGLKFIKLGRNAECQKTH